MTIMTAKTESIEFENSENEVSEEESRNESEADNENSDANDNSEEESHNDSEADNEDSDANDNSEDDTGFSNAGWADSIAKILKTNKPKGKKTLVLSKAKKLGDVKRDKSKPAGFEIETETGDIKEEKVQLEIKEDKLEGPPRKKKKELPNLRVKPNILEKDRERLLSKIATKGVVQLFNAVKTQQKDISTKLKEAGPLEVKKEKVMKNIDKRAFLDVLMGEKSTNVENVVQNSSQKTKNSESTWNVLKDDFMMSAKMKDWDKELENESEEENQEELEENMESD